MSTADRVSTIVAVLAILIAFVALYVMWRMRGQQGAGPVDPGEEDRIDAADSVSVVLVADAGGGQAWRLELADGAPPASLDVFSFKRRSGGSRDRWHHELMDGPRALVPRRPIEFNAPPPVDGAVYEVSLGWTTDGAPGSKSSAFVLVPSAPPG